MHGSATLVSDHMTVIRTNCVQALPVSVVIDAYREFRAGGNTHSLRAIEYDLEYFSAYASRRIHAPQLGDITRGLIEAFLESRLGQEAPSTAARRLATVRSFCRWAARTYDGFSDPSRGITEPTIDPSVPKRLSATDALAILEHASNGRYDPHERSRNRLVILLQLAMGLRVAEVQKLNFGDFENGTLRVSGKGRHFRHLPIPAAVAGELNWYLQCREVELKRRYRLWVSVPEDRRKRYPLLVTRHVTGGFAPNDFRVSIKGLYEVVRQAGERAGLKDVHPHLLRHTFAHDLLDKTHNIALVAKALGHKSLRHTQRYVDPTDKDMREAMA